ncbi:MAG: sigma-70 family RNA polymerase sigma factor [Candidatus Eisenbacteria bacterium]|uniref:Sigma-70 family RNA polymerase sigma factor n=1 Tax=Eiseniibacteriota bacterium TaxID=2212470 RepID=A0A7Y2E942_UNCEI|nr:sigma-70 family RNA polymerase sigma factor [Candidatus Eisenbacteria bacterium]
MQESDQDLVERAKLAASGDTRAFDELVRRHQEKVLANCRYLSGSEHDAQDLAQEVFVKVYFGLKKFEARSQFGTWVQRIKINHCLNFLRGNKNVSKVDIQDPVTQMDPQTHLSPKAEKDLHTQDQRAQIQTILDEMPDTLRLPLIMRDLDELSYQEIADSLGIGLSATKMRIKRAREEFRERYDSGTKVGV